MTPERIFQYSLQRLPKNHIPSPGRRDVLVNKACMAHVDSPPVEIVSGLPGGKTDL